MLLSSAGTRKHSQAMKQKQRETYNCADHKGAEEQRELDRRQEQAGLLQAEKG